MNKFLIFLIAALVAWFYFHTPAGARYYSTEEAEFDVKVVTASATHTGGAKMHYGGTTTFNGLEYHKFTFVFEPKLAMPDEYLFTRLTENGIYARTFSPNKPAPEYPVIAFPLRSGNKWHDMINGYVRENTLVNIGSCYTPAKTYRRCLHIQSRATTPGYEESRTTVYAPDVGLVLMDYKNHRSRRSIEMVRKPGNHQQSGTTK